MANMLKKVKAKEKRERSRFMQAFIMALIFITLLSGFFAAGLWIYTSNSEAERRAIAEHGITALARGNLMMARKYLEEADAKAEPYATEFLAWMDTSSGHYNDALRYAVRANNFQRFLSFELLGDLAIIGVGVDSAKGGSAAISYFEQGALRLAREQIAEERGVDIDDLFTNEHGVLRDDPEVNERAIALFSDMVQRALPLFQDDNDYSNFIMRAKRKGAKNLEIALGDMLFRGNDRFAANAEKALEYWQSAMENGDARALDRLAGAYWHGYAVKRDPQAAIDLYSTSASQHRSPVAMYALGLISLRHPQANANGAVNLFNNAASLGYGPASTALGVLAMTETYNAQSISSARNWFRIAAEEQRDLSGRIFYDLMLMSGTGGVRDFVSGFDDILILAKSFPPAQTIIDLLQKRVAPEDILRESLILSNLVLRGQLAYREGDPLAPLNLKDPVTGEEMERPFSYYTSVTKMDQNIKQRFGERNFTAPMDLAELTINNQKIISPELAKLVVQFAPATGVSAFDQVPLMPRPLPPKVPSHYSISDFVPPAVLVQTTPLFSAPHVFTTIDSSLFDFDKVQQFTLPKDDTNSSAAGSPEIAQGSY